MTHSHDERQSEYTAQQALPALGIAISAECWLEVRPVQIFVLPIGPDDLVSAMPPRFGQAILLDQAICSEEERIAYETAGLCAQPGLHWRFPDEIAWWVEALYKANPGDIAAWRNADRTWDAYALSLPTAILAALLPSNAPTEQGVEPASRLNSAQQRSVERIRVAVRQIEELVPQELQRQAQQRKHQLETAFSSLSLHAHKLGLQVPALSTYYNPQQYLDHARAIVGQLRIAHGVSVGEQSKPGEGKASDAVPLIDPAILPHLLPDLLVINARERSRLEGELQVITKLNRLFGELDMAQILQLNEAERQVAYPLLEAISDREESRITDALQRVDEQRGALLALLEDLAIRHISSDKPLDV